MPDKKDLSEIRPAKGAVKVKRKNPQPPLKRKRQEKPKVIQNAKEENQTNELPLPSDEALRISAQLKVANMELMDAMKAFNKLLNDQVLPENKPSKDKENEQNAVNRLASAAINVENLSPGQGLLALSILSIRQALSLRDAGNTLAYKVYQMEEKIQKIEKMLANSDLSPDDSKKEYLKELAEKMGLEISIK